MIHTKLTDLAYHIALECHKNQVDRGGQPYIMHPVAIAEQMPDEIMCSVALLHDVLEDCDISPKFLSDRGVPPDIISRVVLLTRLPSDSYFDYIQKVSLDPIATEVKRADLKHNMMLGRLNRLPTKKDLGLYKRYEKALEMLGEHIAYCIVQEEEVPSILKEGLPANRLGVNGPSVYAFKGPLSSAIQSSRKILGNTKSEHDVLECHKQFSIVQCTYTNADEIEVEKENYLIFKKSIPHNRIRLIGNLLALECADGGDG